jgi:hypothetical protein
MSLTKEKKIIITLMRFGGFSEKVFYVKSGDFRGVQYPFSWVSIPVLKLVYGGRKSKMSVLIKGEFMVDEGVMRRVVIGVPWDVKPLGMQKRVSAGMKSTFKN